MFLALIIFNGCQKDDQVLIDEQPIALDKPDFYVEENYLVFKDFSELEGLKKVLNNSSFETLKEFETKNGFNSAFSFRNEIILKADKMTDVQISKYLEEMSNKGYFDKENQMFTYPFYNESYAKVLNPDGKVKIGKTFYQFKGMIETVTIDLKEVNAVVKPDNMEHSIQLNSDFSNLKSAEMLKETMLRDNQLRCLLQLKREQFVLYDWIIVDGQVVWGVVGYNWEVYYRFYSYRQYLLYKSDRPTYFNWKTKQAQIGGNNGFWYLNYYNANPPVERSPYEAAVYYFVIYGSGLIQSQIPPYIYAVEVSDFWSDYMSSFHGSLVYP